MSRENLSSGFPTRSNTDGAVQPSKMDRGLKFRIKEVEGFFYQVLICWAITFVMAYAKRRSSYDMAHLSKY